MNLGLNLRAVVVKDVEDEMTLMVVSGDIASVNRNVVGDQRIGHDAFLQPEVFGGMARVETAHPGLKFLAVAAGMQEPTDVVMAEDLTAGRSRYSQGHWPPARSRDAGNYRWSKPGRGSQ